MAGPDEGFLFGEEMRQRLRGREREIFPPLTRPWFLGVMWIALTVVFSGLLVVTVLLGALR